MISAENTLTNSVQVALQHLYDISDKPLSFQKTRKEFEGDFTLVTFPFIKDAKRTPEQMGQELGEYLIQNNPLISAFNVVKGFLNISLSDAFWTDYFKTIKNDKQVGLKAEGTSGKTVMLEYSSPNTNKPLHLGHVRNNLLGYSVAQILKANGHTVIKTNIVNDRGIHICKSMLAWQLSGKNETPLSSGLKGDHLVGKYYVEFDKINRESSNELIQNIAQVMHPLTTDSIHLNNKSVFSFSQRLPIWKVLVDFDVNFIPFTKKELQLKENAQKWFLQLRSEINNLLLDEDLVSESRDIIKTAFKVINSGIDKLPISQANDMLRQWEAEDKAVVDLWSMMNGWVYEGFDVTYKALGVDFDKMYYESNTYLLGKEIVEEGLKCGVFYRKENGSVAIDLSKEGLDEKIVLRADGTSIYITQDLGTAIERFKEFPDLQQLIYTVGNEQDYHFKVLFKILEKLGYSWAKECYHLSYGMVELPEGKMKSREGTVVDADELLQEMYNTAEETTKDLGKVESFSDEELKNLYHTISMGALKYFILKVDPKKKMLFDPKESIDFNGHTGPFIQYTHARIRSVIRKAVGDFQTVSYEIVPNAIEKEIIKCIYDFNGVVKEAGETYSPALVANYVYELAKLYNRFYHEFNILKEENADLKNFRLQLSVACAQVISNGMMLLGIPVPERM